MAERPALVSNAADQVQVREAKIKERNLEKDVLDDIRWIMGEARGRRYMSWLMGQCGMDRLSFTGNSETFFREGARNIGIMLKSKIDEVAPEMYIKMLTETLERNKNAK